MQAQVDKWERPFSTPGSAFGYQLAASRGVTFTSALAIRPGASRCFSRFHRTGKRHHALMNAIASGGLLSPDLGYERSGLSERRGISSPNHRLRDPPLRLNATAPTKRGLLTRLPPSHHRGIRIEALYGFAKCDAGPIVVRRWTEQNSGPHKTFAASVLICLKSNLAVGSLR